MTAGSGGAREPLDLDAIEAGLTTGAFVLGKSTSLALVAELRLERERSHGWRTECEAAISYSCEMERQRNEFGEALTRAANGESPTGAAVRAMVRLQGASDRAAVERVRALCDEAEAWHEDEDESPVPSWVAEVRRALDPETAGQQR